MPGFWDNLVASLGRPSAADATSMNPWKLFYGMTTEGKAAGQTGVAEMQAAGDKAGLASATAQSGQRVLPSSEATSIAGNQYNAQKSQSDINLLPGQESLAGEKTQLDRETVKQIMKWAADNADKNPLAAANMEMFHRAHNTQVQADQGQENFNRDMRSYGQVKYDLGGREPGAVSTLQALTTGDLANKGKTTENQRNALRVAGEASDADRLVKGGLPATPAAAGIEASAARTKHDALGLDLQKYGLQGREMTDLVTMAPYLPPQMMGLVNSILTSYDRQPLPMQSDPGMNAALRAHAGTQKMINPNARQELGIPAGSPQKPTSTTPTSVQPQVQDRVQQLLQEYGIAPKTSGQTRTGYASPTSASPPQVQLQGLQQLETQLGQGKTKGKEGQDRNTKLEEVRAMIRQLQQRLGAQR